MSYKAHQKGVIFLALVLILFVTGSTMMLGALNNRQSASLAQDAELHIQLELAKENLLAYLANSNRFFADARGPGFFPCPDTNADGVAETSCNPTNTSTTVCGTTANRPRPQLGRLPRYVEEGDYRVELNDYYRAAWESQNPDPDRQFWYVVAPRYVYYTSATATNIRRSRTRTSTSETVTAPSPPPACTRLFLDDEGGYVAFIIAPGEELETQNRAGNSSLYSNYLDGQNGANNYYYYTNYESNPALFNDQIIGITLEEYVKAVGMRVAIESKKQIDDYYGVNGYYPTTQANFRLELDDAADHVWLMPSTNAAYNGEIWATYTSYTDTNPQTAVISFNGCAGITFTLTWPDGIQSSGDSCD